MVKSDSLFWHTPPLFLWIDNFPIGPQEPLLAGVKRRKLARFGHVTRHDSLYRTIFQGTLAGGQRRGRQRKHWMDNIKEWTSLLVPELLTRDFCRKDWRMISAESSLMSPRRPNRSRDWTVAIEKNGGGEGGMSLERCEDRHLKAESLEADEAFKAISWPTSGRKERTFGRSGLSVEGTFISVSSVLHRGYIMAKHNLLIFYGWSRSRQSFACFTREGTSICLANFCLSGSLKKIHLFSESLSKWKSMCVINSVWIRIVPVTVLTYRNQNFTCCLMTFCFALIGSFTMFSFFFFTRMKMSIVKSESAVCVCGFMYKTKHNVRKRFAGQVLYPESRYFWFL